MRLKMITNGDSVNYDALTAAQEDVLEGKDFIGSGDEEIKHGGMIDRERMHGAPGFSGVEPNIPVHQSVTVKTTTDTNGNKQIAIVPPEGKYPGNGKAYVGVYPAEIGIDPLVIANGMEIGGVEGKFGLDTTAGAKDVRDGKTFINKDGRQIGEGGDFGPEAEILQCGESYIIQEGFHRAGKVSAATLSSQTKAKSGSRIATGAQILKGYGAWSEGIFQDGELPQKGNAAASGCVADTGSQQLRFTIPETAKYVQGNYLSRTFEQIRGALGIVAAVIRNGTTIAGIKGTYGGDATAEDEHIVAGKTAYGKNGKIIGKLELSAGNIRKGVSYAGITGNWYGNKESISAFAIRGFGSSSGNVIPAGSQSFTMPEDGMVYYGGISARYGSAANGLCRILKNGIVMDNRDLSGTSYIWRSTMMNMAFVAKKGDTITVMCTAESGSATVCFIQATIVY